MVVTVPVNHQIFIVVKFSLSSTLYLQTEHENEFQLSERKTRIVEIKDIGEGLQQKNDV
jgi:hypothetical protein